MQRFGLTLLHFGRGLGALSPSHTAPLSHTATASFSTSPSPLSLNLQQQTKEQQEISSLISLNALKPNKGAHKVKRRVGRGPGSTKGKTCGRGYNGAKSRSGKETSPGFEGGQTPLYQRVLCHGFSNYHFKREYEPLNLGTLQQFIDRGRINPNEVITMKVLRDANLISKKPGNMSGVKLLARGEDYFCAKNLKIEVSQCSERAREAIENHGGKVTTIYLDKLGLRKFLSKPLEEINTKFAAAKMSRRKYFDVWHYIPDQEGRPQAINEEDYRKKPAHKA